MTLSAGMLKAIARAVHQAGGDPPDAEDLAGAWERLEHDWQPRVDRMRHEARTVACSCADGGDEPAAGRCRRCCGSSSG